MHKKIMIVEDEECLQQLITVILTGSGYEVFSAVSGTQALGFLAQNRVDLVLLDVMLPDIDGFEVCRQLKQLPDYVDVPVVMLTAKKSDDDFDLGNAVGAAWYIPKPFKSANVIRVIERLTA